ncbi:MAG: hypothetical protein ACI81T_002823, partial [Bacteroidia bacterium]
GKCRLEICISKLEKLKFWLDFVTPQLMRRK